MTMAEVMAFYSPDPAMGQRLAEALAALEAGGRAGLREELSITWLRYGYSLPDASAGVDAERFWATPVLGASHQGQRLRYPASVVKLVYLAAAEAWLQRQLLPPGEELSRALAAMVEGSSNDATSLVVDLLSGTTSGPDLPPDRFEAWVAQRQLVNRWLAELNWPELDGCNAAQKTWGDGPYGRERQFYSWGGDNRNRLSTDAVARLLHGVMGGALVSPPACQRMQRCLRRSLDASARAADPENQVDGFIGAALPQGSRLWSKAGWMSSARHDAAYLECDGQPPALLVIFSEGAERAADDELLPALTTLLLGSAS